MELIEYYLWQRASNWSRSPPCSSVSSIKREALGREIEGAMKVAASHVFPNFLPGLWTVVPSRSRMCCPPAAGTALASEQLAYEMFHPGAVVVGAAAKQRWKVVRPADAANALVDLRPNAAKTIKPGSVEEDRSRTSQREAAERHALHGTNENFGHDCDPAECLSVQPSAFKRVTVLLVAWIGQLQTLWTIQNC